MSMIKLALALLVLFLLVNGTGAKEGGAYGNAPSGGGCATTRFPPSQYTCDWCSQLFFVASDPNQEKWGYTPTGPVPAKTTVIRDAEGHTFCSLKCENAYLASKGVKEQRTRSIQGE